MLLVYAGQEAYHGGANVGAPVSHHVGINGRTDVVVEDEERGVREARHGLLHDRIRSALVASQYQEARCQGAKGTGVHAPWANERQGGDAVGIAGRQSPPVAPSTGRKVGALDTEVLQKLSETFLYREFDHGCLLSYTWL